jgi:hypothetical protein
MQVIIIIIIIIIINKFLTFYVRPPLRVTASTL